MVKMWVTSFKRGEDDDGRQEEGRNSKAC